MSRMPYLLSASLLACAASAQPVWALSPGDATGGTPDAASSATPPPGNDTEVREIVVTAEHRTSTAQKTAASISVRSGEEMLLKGRYELKNILEDVPGVSGGAADNVNTSKGGGTDNPAVGLTIRGVQSNSGAGGSTVTTAPAAAFYIDDVYNGVGGAYDVNRVEILRGPQGTLYGRSATAGLVAIHTNDPDTHRLSADFTTEYGNYKLMHYTGALNVPIVTDKLAIRISGNEYDRDGYYSAGGDTSSTDLRVKALWTPTTNFSALLGYAQNYNTTHSGGVTINQGSSPTDFVYTPQAVAPGHNDFHQYWGNFNLKAGPVELTYIPAYRTWYQNATLYSRGALDANQTVLTPKDEFMTHELRIRSTAPDSRFKWQAGLLYYENSLNNTNNLYNLASLAYLYQSKTYKKTTAEGLFAEATYAFTHDTRLTGGIRYDHTDVTTTEDYTGLFGTTLSLTGNDGKSKFNNVTYKARVEHDLTAKNMLYASVSTGFSPGDITISTDTQGQPQKQVLTSETLTTYEIGSKNRFFGNRLQINGDWFYNNYGGYQTAAVNVLADVPGPPQFAFNVITVPVKSYGGELEVQGRPWASGVFNLNIAYTHARFGSFGQYAEFFRYSSVPGFAPFQASLSYDHHISVGKATLLLDGDVRYMSAHDTASITRPQAALGGSDYARVGGEVIGDLNATLMFGEHFSITGYVRNVADNRFLPDGWGLAFVTPGATAGAPNVEADRDGLSDPRTFGMIVRFKY